MVGLENEVLFDGFGSVALSKLVVVKAFVYTPLTSYPVAFLASTKAFYICNRTKWCLRTAKLSLTPTYSFTVFVPARTIVPYL
jgi:hypothetical protein